MELFRIIDKTGVFVRDDFTWNEETEIGLDVQASQGLYQPRWNGTEWVEGATEIPTPQPTQPTLEERVMSTETKVVSIEETLEVLFL